MIFDNLFYRKKEIKLNHRGCNFYKVIVSDTETCKGEPFLFQNYDGEKLSMIFCNKNNIFEKWIKNIESYLNTETLNVIFFFNLNFDMVSLFYKNYSILADESFETDYKDWTIKGIYSDTSFFTIRNEKYSILVIDAFMFYRTSLAKCAEVLNLKIRKLEAPKGLGDKKFTIKDKYFMEYAKTDVYVLWEVAQSILKLHEDFDISISVSIPQLGSKIFRHHFMKHSIPLPHKGIIYASLYSYHGGKNLCTVEKGMYKNVYSYDIVSAYPYAMSQFPSFSYLDKYYKIAYVQTYKELNPYGVYKISGIAKDCKFPILYSHNYQPLKGKFCDVWVTGFELKEALKEKEVKLSSMFGYAYDAKEDKRISPFKKYVDYFFRKKNESDGVLRHQYKLLLNSLYGKFIQTVKRKGDSYYDVDKDEIISNSVVEGTGMFHPFIASLITGHTRAYIHQLEHLTDSIHTSTDSVKTFKKLPKKYLSDKLGQLQIECLGDCLIWRSRLYIHWNGKRKNGDIRKYALHGFRGTKEQLISMFDSNTHTYTYKKMNKLKESIRSGLIVNHFETREAEIRT